MSKSLWLDRSLFVSPYYYRLCLTEKDFHKELKMLELPKKHWPEFIKNDHSDATVHYFKSNEDKYCAIVCLRHPTENTLEEIYGLLVHEAMHIWR